MSEEIIMTDQAQADRELQAGARQAEPEDRLEYVQDTCENRSWRLSSRKVNLLGQQIDTMFGS